MAESSTTLLTILSNELLLLSTTPYLSPFDILSLSLSCRSAHNLLAATPLVHRYLNFVLKRSSKSMPRAYDHSLERRSYRLLRILSTSRILRSTRTLVLDKLPVTVQDLYSFITPKDWQSEIQLLSLRGCTQIDQQKFVSFLNNLVRPSCTEESLSLKGVYWFSDRKAIAGRFVKNQKLHRGAEWAALLKSCEGIISFDTRVCQGHKHRSSLKGEYIQPKLATIRLRDGCAGCEYTPRADTKGLLDVLVGSVPLFGSVGAACKGTNGEKLGDVLRCEDCVMERGCECCGKWLCAECFVEKKYVKRTCSDCGSQCEECTIKSSGECSGCGIGICTVHNLCWEEDRCSSCNHWG